MEDLVIWVNNRCSKSRRAESLLQDRDVAYHRRAYLDDPPSRAEVEAVLHLMGTDDPRTIMRTRDDRYAELGLATADRDALLEALVAHPILLERPIAIRGERAIVARPPERVLELLG